jgi:ParB/RepB/Spo0J family partition protein
MDTLVANAADVDVAAQTIWLPLSHLDLPADARTHNPDKLTELADDIKRNGQLQEIVVTPLANGRFEIIAGAGRFQAARQLGWEKIRCLVREGLSEFDRLHITFSENEEREDVSPLYQAAVLDKMRGAGNLTQEKLADKLGKTRVGVQQYLSLMALPDLIRGDVNRFTFLGLAHFLQLLRLSRPVDQIKLAQDASKGEWSVRELKAKVDQILGPTPGTKRKAAPLEDPFATLWSNLQKDPALPPGSWEVKYHAGGTWTFAVHTHGEKPLDKLGAWFRMGANAIKGDKGGKSDNGDKGIELEPLTTPTTSTTIKTPAQNAETPESLLSEIQKTMPAEFAKQMAKQYKQITAAAKAANSAKSIPDQAK